MLHDPEPFRANLNHRAHVESVPTRNGHVAAFPPQVAGSGWLSMRRLDECPEPITGEIVFLPQQPTEDTFDAAITRAEMNPIDQPIALLTNGRGAMARMAVDLGAIKSKYDCLLGANLNDELPVSRQVLIKRIRAWAVADGFITALNADNLLDFQPGPPARWRFLVSAGDNRTVEVELTAAMSEGQNATVLNFRRLDKQPAEGGPLAAEKSFSLTVRVDIEDRDFHSETILDDAAYSHFEQNTTELDDRIGFLYAPSNDKRLMFESNSGHFHRTFEWPRGIVHR